MAWLANPSISQRLLGFSLGAGTGVVSCIASQRMVWKNTAEVCELYGYKPTHSKKSPVDESVWGPKTRAYLVQSWNHGVDNTLGALSVELAKRGL